MKRPKINEKEAVVGPFLKKYEILYLFHFSFSLLTHIIFAILPGNNPSQFYICTTTVPKSYWDAKPKVNWMLISTLFLSALAHLLIGLRYVIYKVQERMKLKAGKLKGVNVIYKC